MTEEHYESQQEDAPLLGEGEVLGAGEELEGEAREPQVSDDPLQEEAAELGNKLHEALTGEEPEGTPEAEGLVGHSVPLEEDELLDSSGAPQGEELQGDALLEESFQGASESFGEEEAPSEPEPAPEPDPLAKHGDHSQDTFGEKLEHLKEGVMNFFKGDHGEHSLDDGHGHEDLGGGHFVGDGHSHGEPEA